MCNYILEDYNEILHIRKKIKINDYKIDKLSKQSQEILEKYTELIKISNKLDLENKYNKLELNKIVSKYLTTFNKYILIKIFEHLKNNNLINDNYLCNNVYMTCSYFKKILDNDFTYFIFKFKKQYVNSRNYYSEVIYIPRQPFINFKQSICQIFYCEYKIYNMEILLHYICDTMYGYDIIKYLVITKKIKLDFNMFDNYNFNCIMTALFRQKFKLSKLLIETGVDYKCSHEHVIIESDTIRVNDCFEYMDICINKNDLIYNKKDELINLFNKYKQKYTYRNPIIKNKEFINEILNNKYIKNNIKHIFEKIQGNMKLVSIIGNDNFE